MGSVITMTSIKLLLLFIFTYTVFSQQQQQPNQPRQTDSKSETRQTLLVGNYECSVDVAKYCSQLKGPELNDYALLDCLQNVAMTEANGLTSSCENAIWNFKLTVTSDVSFKESAKNFCANEIQGKKEFADCLNYKDNGEALTCLMEHASFLEKTNRCYQFMSRIETIVFSDFRLMAPFLNKCKNAIQKLQCGSIQPPKENKFIRIPHSQGSTLECLIKAMTKKQHNEPKLEIDEECKHEIFRISELQSEDFHLDRPLFFACRDDREKFCHNVQSGDGKVFECLIQHRTDPKMEPGCAALLAERAQLVGEDYKLAHPLVKACEAELKNYNCVPNKQALAMSQNYHLTQVLLCLENGLHMRKADPNNAINKLPDYTNECRHEMITFRGIMAQEFHMSPELVINCAEEISQFCSSAGDIEKDGKTLHCLMGIAKDRTKNNQISPKCSNALGIVVKVVDIGSNYKVDKILMASCSNLIMGKCANDAISETATLTCLMQHIDTPDMNQDCEDRLIEVQYFMARDWSLDPELYDSCHDEAVKRCSALENWHVGTNNQNKVDPGPHVLACLYRAGYDEADPLSPRCANQVRRVLRQRAIRVNLLPDVEEYCRGALSEYCSGNTAPKEEMMCLQTYFEKKSFKEHYPQCYDAVSTFTAIESKDTKVNRLLTKACRPVIHKYCEQYINEGIDHGAVMECLVKNKNTDEMTNKCRTYVHHYELITLRDYHFSYNFATACKNDIELHCKGSDSSKGEIIRCLSNIVFEHKILDSKVDISKGCKQQLRVQYLQQEQVNFDVKEHMEDADPQLMMKCKSEIKLLSCDKEQRFEDVIECLRQGYNQLGNDCRSMIFGREKIEAVDNLFDDELQVKCKSDIHKFCDAENKERVLPCLSNHRVIRLLQPQCQKVVRERLMEQSRDVRLNPGLVEACKTEAETYCPDHYKLLNHPRYSQQELQSIFVTCLRENYISKTAHLSAPCKEQISNLILESEFDIALDPPLYKACQTIINRHCSSAIISKNGKFDTVLECLKADFYSGVISDPNCAAQVARRTQESIVDINLDPALHEACDKDIRQYCRDTPPGQSRIITCLLDALEIPRIKLSSGCQTKLMERKKLWNIAHEKYKMAIPETWNDLLDAVESIQSHPQRNSILSFFGIFLIIILILGCCCGRCTKRTHMEMKNR
uniref:Golgi apparatus protein 1 n=1 Tax=Parastrongyloides trichosuri TaxID=131310 RepID=A0A0N4ZII0_PARTI